MQHHLKTGSMLGALIFLGLSSRDLNTHLPLPSLHLNQATSNSQTVLAQNMPRLMMSKKMLADL